MLELAKNELETVRFLCNSRSNTVLFASIEGNIGRAWIDSKKEPTYSVIIAGDFAFLLGSVEALKEVDVPLWFVLEECRGKIIITNEFSWISLLSQHYSDSFQKFNRYSFKKESNFQIEQLKENIKMIDTAFKIVPIDEHIYPMVLQDPFMADCCCFFSSLEEFMQHGIGFVILKDNQIIAGASSYTYHEGCIEVTIGTHPLYRRQGLALACASRLILECLSRNIHPNWEAANIESVALAEKLGYKLEKEYEVYSI
ncbi:GNAT family N-acetyltransferase [Paenibacillus sp. RRE4]|uniref:GNAT family N-acetyltransferase n=1 Tax=Paenibacillus sp. RRE4 TaxID=2962587 RepID=UPI002882412B|nr:GNAT family N-acetyltransferase [Paenibacillus sp. RRE4]MDT0121580.1 GNAT family N-acetyltransferase [Paenibacillus sp. RRE4]